MGATAKNKRFARSRFYRVKYARLLYVERLRAKPTDREFINDLPATIQLAVFIQLRISFSISIIFVP